jgi:hypothetical protein
MKKNVIFVLLAFQIVSFGQNIEGPIISPGSEIIREEERRMGRGEVYSASRSRNNTVKPVIPKELKEKLEVSKADKTTYKNSKANIVKLWNNQCANLGKVVDVEKDKDCLALMGYEIGSVYSFENRDYFLQSDRGIFSASRIYPNAGISLNKERFQAQNIQFAEREPKILLTQIMTDLGETSLENIEKDSLTVKNFSAVQLFNDVGKSIWKENQKNSALKYSDDLPALINHTYLLRSVFIDSQMSSSPRIKETIYAFQFVGFQDNIAVIVWKKVSSKWV